MKVAGSTIGAISYSDMERERALMGGDCLQNTISNCNLFLYNQVTDSRGS
jgi:hypothetical protein